MTDRQLDRHTELSKQEGKQTVIGAVRQEVGPGILWKISKLSEEGDK